MVKTDFGVFICAFDIKDGVQCSCGFENCLNDNFVTTNVEFIFCDHITCFLIDLIRNPDKRLKNYINDIIPRSVKDQYVLNYLLEKGLVHRDETNKNQLKCTQFGKLVIRLYIRPTTAVHIRTQLENDSISDNRSLLEVIFEILKMEHRIRKDKYFEALIDWVDEVSMTEIIERYKIDTGDLYNLTQNADRTVTFINIIASRLANSSYDRHDTFIGVAELCETMALRIRYGVREQLFDLVLRVDYVGRVRGRILYNAGIHTADQLNSFDAYRLNQKTGIGINWCKKIIAGYLKKKDKKQK
jgi:replicative superfamily II helicase